MQEVILIAVQYVLWNEVSVSILQLTFFL